MSRIAKIKNKDGRVQIVSIEGEGTTNEAETLHKIYDEPHDDFRKAMSSLEAHARDILQWPVEYAKDRVRITGVSYSFSENTGVEGAVITGLVDLDTSDSPFSFNTPHLAFEQYSETGAAKLMPEEAQDALELLRKEALAFLKGKRAQSSLFSFQQAAE